MIVFDAIGGGSGEFPVAARGVECKVDKVERGEGVKLTLHVIKI